jgi:uncharacterized membrane protein
MTGLVMLLPLALTLWIIGTIVSWLTGPFTGITEKILSSAGLQESAILFLTPSQTFYVLDKLLILIFLFFFILGIGAVGKQFFVSYFLRLGDTLLHKIPIISSVYQTSQELINAIFTTDQKAFKQVVLVPFPNENCLTVGLVTKEDGIDPALVPVYVPTTPNPTSGYIILYDRKKVIPIDMSIEEAFRYVLSCGALLKKEGLTQTHSHLVAKKN